MPLTKSPVARILDLVKLEKSEISAIYFYAILNGLIQLSLPLGVQSIIGFVLGASMRASLIILIILVVAGVFMAGIMQVNQMKIIEKIQQKIFVRYSFAITEHIPKLDLKKTDKIYLPELVNRFFDIQVLQKSISKLLLDIPSASIQILLGLLLLSFYHPAFIFFGIILVAILWLILKYSGNKGLQTSIDESTYKYNVAGWLEETARIIKSIKLAKNSGLHIKKTDEYVANYLDSRNSHFRILLFQYNVLIVFKTVITAAMLIVGTLLLVNQQLNIGQFIAAEIIILLILNSVEKLIINLGTVYDTLTAVEKISGITDKPKESNGTIICNESESGLKIELKNVSFSYDDERNIINNLSAIINPNEKVCIRGKDSTGKSTLLQLIAGAFTDFKGALLLDDIPLGNYNLSSVRQQTGVLLSQQDIFHGTLLENITFGNDNISLDSVKHFAAKVGLTEYIVASKTGYDTMLDPTGKKLPRNVVHKILLVRSLIGKPRLLLLEEPFLLLSNEHQHQVAELIHSLKNTTVIVVSNDENFAKGCDKIITLTDRTDNDGHNNYKNHGYK